MRSSLFDKEFLERPVSGSGMTLQNHKLLKVRLESSEVMAQQGSMVAFQGQVDFSYQGSGMKRFLKKALTGEDLQVMRVSGTGDVFLADTNRQIFLVDLEGDSITVAGSKVLAFDNSLTWDIHRVKGAGMMAGGLFNTVFTGVGRLAITSEGPPLVLDCAEAPTFVDTNAVVAWSSGLRTSVNRTITSGALVGRGSGEAVQLALEGTGFVVVQPSEGIAIGSQPGVG